MALENLRDKIWKPAVAMSISAGMALSPAAAQQTGNAQPDQNFPRLMESQEDRQAELAALGEALEDGRAFAREGFNAALILSVGQDMPNDAFASQEELGEFFRNHYQAGLDQAYPRQEPGVDVFYAPNPDGNSSIMTILIGNTVFEVDKEKYGYGEDRDPANLDMQTAYDAVGDLAEALPAAKLLQLEENQRRQPDTTAMLGTVADSPRSFDQGLN